MNNVEYGCAWRQGQITACPITVRGHSAEHRNHVRKALGFQYRGENLFCGIHVSLIDTRKAEHERTYVKNLVYKRKHS